MDTREFSNKVAIVTGTSGIGRAVAVRLATGGAQAIACGIDEAANAEMRELVLASGLPIVIRQVDVSSPEQVQAAVDYVGDEFGGLDIIVNSAAIHPFGDAVQTSIEVWRRCFEVNVTGIFLFAHYGIPELRRRGGGAIVNLASVQGHACQEGVAAYAMSKGAIHSLTRALAIDHAADGVRVNSVSPGSIHTPMLEFAAKKFSPELPVEDVVKRFGKAHPLGRVGTPEEVAEMVAFLASDRARFCTGGDYLVDGGLRAGIGVR